MLHPLKFLLSAKPAFAADSTEQQPRNDTALLSAVLDQISNSGAIESSTLSDYLNASKREINDVLKTLIADGKVTTLEGTNEYRLPELREDDKRNLEIIKSCVESGQPTDYQSIQKAILGKDIPANFIDYPETGEVYSSLTRLTNLNEISSDHVRQEGTNRLLQVIKLTENVQTKEQTPAEENALPLSDRIMDVLRQNPEGTDLYDMFRQVQPADALSFDTALLDLREAGKVYSITALSEAEDSGYVAYPLGAGYHALDNAEDFNAFRQGVLDAIYHEGATDINILTQDYVDASQELVESAIKDLIEDKKIIVDEDLSRPLRPSELREPEQSVVNAVAELTKDGSSVDYSDIESHISEANLGIDADDLENIVSRLEAMGEIRCDKESLQYSLARSTHHTTPHSELDISAAQEPRLDAINLPIKSCSL